VFRFSGLEAARITVAVSSVARQRLWVRGACDGPGEVGVQMEGGRGLRGFGPGDGFGFELAPRGDAMREGGGVLLLGPAVTRCTLDVEGAQPYRMVLEREEIFAPPALRRHDAVRGGCARPVRAAPGDALAAVLAGAGGRLSMDCPAVPGPMRLMPDGLEALQARAVALTGAPLPDAVLAAGDITAPLDFSRAPVLDVIYLSSLHMRADFTGYMLARMLAFHAARGTTVRILLSDLLQRSLDRQLYMQLAARYPGVQLQLMRGPRGGGVFDPMHRANHVKVFATLARGPGRSVFMAGGRNLHDGFVFDAPHDLSRWPNLRDYSAQEVVSFTDFFVTYRDMEVLFGGDADVRRMAAHLAGFWHRDHDTHIMAQAEETGPAVQVSERMVRHFVSVPGADGAALEDLYVALFDAAELRIDLASPFMNMPSRLEAAMERALRRGVAVRLVTRIDIPEPIGIVSTALNRMFVEAHADQLEIIAYAAAPRTLHPKLMVIDGRLGVVSSVNLNQRSFLHDTENGILMLDRARAAEVLREIDALARAGTRQGTAQQVAPLLRSIMAPAFVRRFF
ncbi:MAG TPA: hypothetical protein GX700_15750, partial [Paracoccus sp.]|nr:hypothetical protein [Paracoccus sp. (in: a-proteobacteria)]